MGWAQVNAPSQEENWRRANDAVGQFKRGHADVLKWEQSNTSPTSIPTEQPFGASLAVATVQDAIRLVWKAHPNLAPTISHLSVDAIDSIASSRWDRVDARLTRRVEGLDELLSATAQARKDWVDAVVAQVNFQQSKEMLQAAESARELGDRMVTVGNWSKIQQAPLQIAQVAAQMNVRKSRLAWVQIQNRMLKSFGKVGMYQSLDMPSKMPDLPKSIATSEALQSRDKAIQDQLYYAARFVHRDNLTQAIAAYEAAFENAKLAVEVLKLHQFVTEETVLHYNGMLKSTWDVLTESQNQIQAAMAAVNAQRDFEIAQIDLDWVLLGGEPSGFVALGGGDSAPASGQ
jgi:outer membrane protein TolC